MIATRTWMRFLTLAVALLVGSACSRPVPALPDDPIRTEPWSEECIADLAAVPVQENGRVKPLSVLAAFTLYKVHGRRDLKYSFTNKEGLQEKATLTPIEWLLDTWCYPAQAVHYPLFRIENVKVLEALGFSHDGQKQGFEWLSFAQLTSSSVVGKLQELTNSYRQIEQKQRNAVQEHIVQLYGQLLTYDSLFSLLQPFHIPIDIENADMEKAMGGKRIMLGDLLRQNKEFLGVYRQYGAEGVKKERWLQTLGDYLQEKVIDWDNGGPAIVPPFGKDASSDTWKRAGEGIDQVLRGSAGPLRDMFVGLQGAIAGASHADREQGLRNYARSVGALAEGREDIAEVQRETDYYVAAWSYQSLHWFLFGFVLAAVCWLAPRNRWLWWASMGVTVFAFGLLFWDLVQRCLITGRPPIKNLYDTFLFIAGTGVLLAVIAEFIIPRRIALAAAPLFGALMIMFARLFEVTDGADTMGKLQAVLDSNFWLATHVTSINIGYGAGLIAAVMANIYIYMRVLRIAHPSDSISKALVRMVYGVTCFGLMFAVVGTILGGVWANDSWGRFWGWDPKENGALMICLSQIALLHARFCGWVRDFGFIVWSAVTGMVVVFSWFHTNLLGIGLHAYGFSNGLLNAVWISYMVQLGTVMVGTCDFMLRPNPARAQRTSAPAADAAWPATN